MEEKLSKGEQTLHLVALVLVTLAIALVMAPAALHRRVEPQAVSKRFIQVSTGLLLAGMFPLAVGLGIDLYLICAVFALPWRERRRL